MRLGFVMWSAIAAVNSIGVSAQISSVVRPSWDLAQQYPDAEAWNTSLSEVERRLATFDRLRGTPITLAGQLATLLDEARYLRGRAGNMARFALLTSAMDTRDDAAKARLEMATALEARVEAGVSWLDGAAIALGRERLLEWRAAEPRLAHHGWEMNAAILNASHSYPSGSEAAYVSLERARLTATDAYDALIAADLDWPRSSGEDGTPTIVNADSFGDLSTSRDTTIRRSANAAFYGKLKALEPALGLLLARRMEIDHALATARSFDNGIDAFFGLADGMPAGAFRTMIDSARADHSVLARYARTVARLNRLSELRYADLFANAPDFPRPVPIEEAQDIAIAAAAPMGTDYTRRLRERFAQPWFDLPAREHKGGANGVYWGVGGSHPYAFVSFHPDMAGVRTIAAVGGLTMFYADLPSDKAPVRREDDFPIYGNAIWFAAPMLESDYLYARARSRDERIALLAGDLRRLWYVYFHGLIITDFEDRLERAVAAGEAPTGQRISALYRNVLSDYYAGSGIRFGEIDGEEWLSLPNLFYGHVWDEWAFAMAAAVAMNERVESGDKAVIAAIAAPMRRPDSYSSYDMLRDAKADPTKATMYEAVIRRMNFDMDRLDRELA